MKIPKAKARLVAQLILECIEDGFYPYCEGDEDLFGQCVGFGIHNGMLEMTEKYEWILERRIIKVPPKREWARIDLTDGHVVSILELVEEYNDSGTIEEKTDWRPLVHYLTKTFDIEVQDA